MKSIKSILLLLCILLLTFCKKDSNTSNNSCSTCISLPPYNYPYNADASLSVSINKIRHLGFEDGYPFAYSKYFNQTGNIHSKIYPDSVFINGIKSTKQTGDTSYIAQFNILPSPPSSYTWQIYSNGKFGNFTWTLQKPVVNFYSFTLASTDTLHKMSGFTYNHPTITADSIFYFFRDAVFNYVIKKKTGNSSSITFTPSELAILQNCTDAAYFEIDVYNMERTALNGNLIYSYGFSYCLNNTVSIKN